MHGDSGMWHVLEPHVGQESAQDQRKASNHYGYPHVNAECKTVFDGLEATINSFEPAVMLIKARRDSLLQVHQPFVNAPFELREVIV